MNLDFLDKLTNTIKKNEGIQNFVQNLNDLLEKNNSKRNQMSILEEIQHNTNVTASYRDKMYIERKNILENLANKTANKGTMYYIYDKSENYLITVCENGKSHEIIKANESELPIDAGVDSILRIEDGKYILDKETTSIVQKEMKEKFKELLEKQNKEMESHRIEGHLYEFVEKSKDRVWLLDRNSPKNNNKTKFEVFEEFEFSKKLLNIAKEGDIFKYQNGIYQIYN